MSIKIDQRSAVQLETVTARRLKKAAKIALNQISKDIRTMGIQHVVDKFKFQKGRVSKTVFYIKASESSLKSSVRFGGRAGVPLIYLSPRAKAVKVRGRVYRGVSVKLGSDGQRVVAAGAFFGTTKSGKKLVFKRRGSERLPIDQARANITFGDLFNDKDLKNKVNNRARGLSDAFTSALKTIVDGDGK